MWQGMLNGHISRSVELDKDDNAKRCQHGQFVMTTGLCRFATYAGRSDDFNAIILVLSLMHTLMIAPLSHLTLAIFGPFRNADIQCNQVKKPLPTIHRTTVSSLNNDKLKKIGDFHTWIEKNVIGVPNVYNSLMDSYRKYISLPNLQNDQEVKEALGSYQQELMKQKKFLSQVQSQDTFIEEIDKINSYLGDVGIGGSSLTT